MRSNVRVYFRSRSAMSAAALPRTPITASRGAVRASFLTVGLLPQDQNWQLNDCIDSRAWTTCRLHINANVSFAPVLTASCRHEFRNALMLS